MRYSVYSSSSDPLLLYSCARSWLCKSIYEEGGEREHRMKYTPYITFNKRLYGSRAYHQCLVVTLHWNAIHYACDRLCLKFKVFMVASIQ